MLKNTLVIQCIAFAICAHNAQYATANKLQRAAMYAQAQQNAKHNAYNALYTLLLAHAKCNASICSLMQLANAHYYI